MAEATQKPKLTRKEYTTMFRERTRGFRMAYIENSYYHIEKKPGSFIDDKILEDLDIVVEKLDVTGEDTTASTTQHFFEPLSQSKLEKMPFAPNKKQLTRLERRREIYADFRAKGSVDCLSIAQFLCYDLRDRSSYIPRAGAQKNVNLPSVGPRSIPQALAQFRGWQTGSSFDRLLLPSFRRTAFGLDSRPIDNWEWKDPEEKPHVMFTMKTGVVAEDKFTRGELLSILAIMRARLQCYDLYKHLVTPIMLFSFIGSRGRIIQAYYSGNITLRKSDLFDFSDVETAIDNMDHFVRHLASTPIGDTEESREDDESDSDDCASSRESVDGFELLSSDAPSIPEPARRGWFWRKTGGFLG